MTSLYINNVKISPNLELDTSNLEVEKYNKDIVKNALSSINFNKEEYLQVGDKKVFIFEKDNNIIEFILKNKVENYKSLKHQIIFGVSPYTVKIVDFYKVSEIYKSRYGFGLNLSYRCNLTKHMYAGLAVEYRGFLEQRIPKFYNNEMPITLQFGFHNRLNNKFEIFNSIAAGIKVGNFESFYSFNGTIVQLDFGFNHFLNENVAINVKTNVSAAYETVENQPFKSSITIVSTPIQIGVLLGM